MISVELKGLTKRFSGPRGREFSALDQLDLTVCSGEYLVVVGPSGGGKTTLLRLIAGLETPDIGEVSFWESGRRISLSTAKLSSEIDVAMVFQDSALYPHLTVRGNLELGLKIRRLDPSEMNRRVEELGGACGVGKDWWPRMPSELSGGEKRRVSLARAIVRQPRLLLLDEPLSSLDAPSRTEFRQWLRDLPGRDAMTVIHVTHDQAEAMSLGQRIAVLNKGRLQQIGTPRQVYEMPANLFVAGFIGDSPMNIVAGKFLISECGTPWFTAIPGNGGFKVPTPVPMPAGWGLAHPGGSGLSSNVLLGFRPESAVRLKAVEAGKHDLSGRVDSIDYLGAEIVARIDIQGVPLFVRWPSRREEMTVGETLRFRIEWSGVSWFDDKTGERLNRDHGSFDQP